MSTSPPSFALLLVLAGATLAGARDLGDTEWIGGQYFQYLGTDGDQDVWRYPHTDGIPEVFTVEPDGTWAGALDSRFDPSTGRFVQRFNAAAVLNELMDKDGSRPAKQRAAHLLTVAIQLHPAERAPFYLRGHERRIARHQSAKQLAAAEQVVARCQRLLARTPRPGTHVLEFSEPLRSAEDHYRAILSDGYFDVAIVGGNSKGSKTKTIQSYARLRQFAVQLHKAGFRPATFRKQSSYHPILWEKVIQRFDRPVRVRVQLTGASHNEGEIRRAVANFVEGLARADVLIFLGHSNHSSGGYFVSESMSRFSRFRIGRRTQGADLSAKCHLLGTQPHQIVALQTCDSYANYVRPVREFYEARKTGSVPGFVGTFGPGYYKTFVDRYSALLEGLLEGEGPRSLALRVNALRPIAKAAPLVIRGLLQPRHSFVVPRGVEIVSVSEEGPKRGFLSIGTGTDGRTYPSTAVFPQDKPGDVVQVVLFGRRLLGLEADGQILEVSPETGGAAELADCQSPSDVYFVALGLDGKRLVALDSDGVAYTWRARLGTWKKRKKAPAFRLPSLLEEAELRLTVR